MIETVLIAVAVVLLACCAAAIVALALTTRDLWRQSQSLWLSLLEQRDENHELARIRRQDNDSAVREIGRLVGEVKRLSGDKSADVAHPPTVPENGLCNCRRCRAARRMIDDILGRTSATTTSAEDE